MGARYNPIMRTVRFAVCFLLAATAVWYAMDRGYLKTRHGDLPGKAAVVDQPTTSGASLASGKVQPQNQTGVKVSSAASLLTVSAAEKNYDAFAQCLAKKQVVMYGAFWCPHCADQKKEFGSSFRYVHYVECAVAGQPPNVQAPACRDMQIRKYPTWVFPDGERVEANLTLEKLSEKTGCKLP